MATIGQKTAYLRSRSWRALLSQWSKLRDFRLGIAGRLGVSFAAVTVLATAANVIAEHGSEIIPPAVAPIFRPAWSARPPRIPAPATLASDAANNLLIEALDQLEYALERRANSASAENIQLLNAAARRVQDRLEAYLGELNTPGAEARIRSLKQRADTLRAVGDDAIRRQDERRAVSADYWSHLESIDSQVKKALDRNNWRIFGRVISRQSLLRLSLDLEEIRRQSIQLNLVAAPQNPLALSQGRFRSDLEDSAAALTRLQGAQWCADLSKAYGELLQAQARLSTLNIDSSQGLAPFERSSQELKALVRSTTALVRKETLEGSLSSPTLATGPDPMPPTDTATAVASGTSAPRHQGALLAAITGSVLLILLVVSITTVRSIVVPIRQFMATTDRLAAGNEEARFARGGIKELDALAMSFNRMATSLGEARATNREYQSALESRVDERTRRLQHLAEHDPLTGLPNRRQLLSHLNASLRQAAEANARMALFFIDLDNFKNINDSMGHSFGDLVLKSVAHRLREAAGSSGFAARLGGDEFTVIQADAGDAARVAEFGNDLVRAFQKPLLVEGRELMVSISGGASIYPDHEHESDALLRAADIALFRAKNSGRARVALFSPELLEAASVKFSLEQGLRRALERGGELELWFQPEVSFATMGTKLAEALLRWRIADGKYLAPADFLSVAEDSGLMRSINDWVLRTAFQQAATWHHGEWPDTRVAVNVSARQLLDTGFVTKIRDMLEEFRLPSRCIEIELTETVLQTEVATIEVLRELRRLDVSIALDDFGTGYSSLASLERLPLTRVKLDRSLIDTIDTSTRSLAIARAIMGLCENLGLEVTAEGIERPEQLALMLANPATTLQGYLFSRPVRAEEVLAVLPRMRDRLEELLIEVPAAPGIMRVRPATDVDTLAPGISDTAG